MADNGKIRVTVEGRGVSTGGLWGHVPSPKFVTSALSAKRSALFREEKSPFYVASMVLK